MATLNALLDRSAQEGGEKTALVFGDREVSFLALRQEILEIAEGLRRQGIVNGDRIPIVHRNTPASVDAAIESDVAAILYTSGTTGFPKGVMLTHRNLSTNCESSVRRMGLDRSDVALCILPMFHSFAWTGIVLVSLRLTLTNVVFS